MFELAVAVFLIGLNGLFALSELAAVSASPRLRALLADGRAGAAQALDLAENSGRFLSTVQIGITLIGILAGAFSGAALSQTFDEILEGWGVPTRIAPSPPPMSSSSAPSPISPSSSANLCRSNSRCAIPSASPAPSRRR